MGVRWAARLVLSHCGRRAYVAALETHIGTPLLARTTRRISLTEAVQHLSTPF